MCQRVRQKPLPVLAVCSLHTGPNLIEAKHLKSSGNVADPAACSVHTKPLHKPAVLRFFYTPFIKSHSPL